MHRQRAFGAFEITTFAHPGRNLAYVFDLTIDASMTSSVVRAFPDQVY